MTALDQLDLTWGQRQATFRFDVLNQAGTVIGTIHPDVDSPPKIENNVNRTIKRTMDNFNLNAEQAAAVDTIADRIKPYMLVAGAGPDDYPLGLFLFGGADRTRHSYGLPLSASLVDFTYVLDQPVETTVAYPAGAGIAAALADQYAAAGITDYTIDPVTTVFGSPVVWPAGTSRFAIMAEMAGMAGCFSPYFDNAGAGRVRVVTDLALAPVDVAYGAGGRVFADTIVETDDLLSAPNRYIVIDTSATDSPIVGYYDVPDSAPYSIAARGFVVATVLDVQGLQDGSSANARAEAEAAQDSSTFKWASFDSAPDPRHDTFQIIEWLGDRYREQSWSMTLVDGAPMGHDLRRVYS